MAKPPIRIVLVEDKADFRENWSRLINSLADFQCVRACMSGEEALRFVPLDRPDVVLMDIFLPRMSGIECVRRLKELLPDLRIVMLTVVDDEEVLFSALKAGADGYLLKLTQPEELRAALVEVLKGGAPMSSGVARRVIRFFRESGKDHDDSVRLSAREEEVLVLLTKGYGNKEIADHLSLSVNTVCTYLKTAYKKMRVRSRAEAVASYLKASAK